VRPDGRSDRTTDHVNARMQSFVNTQAASLSEKQVNPDNSIVGKLASMPRATGWAMKAMGFDVNSEAQSQPTVGAVPRPGSYQQQQQQPPQQGLQRQESFSRRGGLFGFGSNRGRKESPGRGGAGGGGSGGGNFMAPGGGSSSGQPTASPVPGLAAASPGGRVLAKRSDSFLSRAKRAMGGTPRRGQPDPPDPNFRQNL